MKSILLSDCKKLWKFQGKRRRASLVGSFSLFAGMTASRSNYLFLRWSWRAELYLLLIWGRAIIEKSFSLDNVSENCLNSRGRCHKAITNTVSIFTRSGWNVSVNTNTVYNAIQRFHLGIFSFVVLSTRSVPVKSYDVVVIDRSLERKRCSFSKQFDSVAMGLHLMVLIRTK